VGTVYSPTDVARGVSHLQLHLLVDRGVAPPRRTLFDVLLPGCPAASRRAPKWVWHATTTTPFWAVRRHGIRLSLQCRAGDSPASSSTLAISISYVARRSSLSQTPPPRGRLAELVAGAS